jgi:eukaryotic-like serine/threonine-protein kinase
VIDENPPHQTGSHTKEVSAVAPPELPLIDEADVSLVDERGWLQRMFGAFATQLRACDTSEMVVDRRYELTKGVLFSVADRDQQSGYFTTARFPNRHPGSEDRSRSGGASRSLVGVNWDLADTSYNPGNRSRDMTPERWDRVNEIYHAARACPEVDRPQFLASACQGDLELECEVNKLLEQPVSTGSLVRFLGGPVLPRVGDIVREDLTGRQLGPYHVRSLVGRGGMGEVYRAHDRHLGRDVAIKVLPPMFTTDDERLARFRSEARMLAAVNHPHIGAIYGFEDAGGMPALVLEFVDGETLADRLNRGPIPSREALMIARQITDALDAAHRKGIVHRDLKPANIKVTTDGLVKVLDFGLAKALAGDVSSGENASQALTGALDTTRVGVVLGTLPYMSPEQASGLPVDRRTDIWAFGCVLFEMLTGKRPFTGETLAETVVAILEREPDWSALPSSTPARVRELLRRCLQRDLSLRVQNIGEARDTIERAQRGSNRWRVAALAAAVVATLAVGAAVWWREPARPVDRSEWVQLTQFPDSVVQPALSPDGRMLAFIRGPSASTPMVSGQVYVKMLPDGEPAQLTNDSTLKLSPVFSPDGSRIAYGTVNQKFEWDVWTVPVLGGTPQTWLSNASGLIWRSAGQILFSEMKKNPHMGVVTAEENRINQRDLYVPQHEGGMAHRSYPSPDGKSVLVAEMDHNFFWMPCRLLPMDGSSAGRQVGPPGGGCTYATWSLDGKWMYLTSNAGGTYHVWRQRFPDGQPEQITSGPTEEEGIAMAPDGRSLVTAVAVQNVSAWLRDPNGEKQILLEGNAVNVQFAPDGKRLFYKVVRAASHSWDAYGVPGEVRVMDVETGSSEALSPGFEALDYDVAPDGQRIVIEVADSNGTSRFWIVSLDRRSPPREILGVLGTQPRFGPEEDIFFRRAEGAAGFVYRVRPDGTRMQRVSEHPIYSFDGVSRDGRWIRAFAIRAANEGPSWQAIPLDGGPSVQLGGAFSWHWSASEDTVAISGNPLPPGRSYIIPLPSGAVLPVMAAEGFRSEKEIAALPGARRIDVDTAVPGPSADVYAFYRRTTQRNLYRIPIR